MTSLLKGRKTQTHKPNYIEITKASLTLQAKTRFSACNDLRLALMMLKSKRSRVVWDPMCFHRSRLKKSEGLQAVVMFWKCSKTSERLHLIAGIVRGWIARVLISVKWQDSLELPIVSYSIRSDALHKNCIMCGLLKIELVTFNK